MKLLHFHFQLSNRKSQFNTGFTLIELLVVISIIAVLASLLMVNFIGVRQRGRDGQRKSNLYQIQTALELYRSDNGTYPLTASYPGCGIALASDTTTYMQKVPCDPLDEPYKYVSVDGTTYSLTACLENSQDTEIDDPTDNSCSTASFTINNP